MNSTNDFMIPWFHDSMIPWFHDSIIPWFHDSMIPWFHLIRDRLGMWEFTSVLILKNVSHWLTDMTTYTDAIASKNLTGNQKYIKTFLFSFRSPSSSSRVSSSSWRMNCQMGFSWRNEEQDLDWRPEAAPGFAQARRGKNRHCLRIYRCSGIKQVWVLYFPWFLGLYVSTCVHKR